MRDVSSFSIERLMRMAYQYRLISDYNMRPDVFLIDAREGGRVECNPEEARYFLQGLLRGYQAGTLERATYGTRSEETKATDAQPAAQ